MIHIDIDEIRARRRREARALAEARFPGTHALVTGEGVIRVAQHDIYIWTITVWKYDLTPAGVISHVNFDSLTIWHGGQHSQDYRIVEPIGER